MEKVSAISSSMMTTIEPLKQMEREQKKVRKTKRRSMISVVPSHCGKADRAQTSPLLPIPSRHRPLLPSHAKAEHRSVRDYINGW